MIALRNFIKFRLLKRGLVEIREDVDGLVTTQVHGYEAPEEKTQCVLGQGMGT